MTKSVKIVYTPFPRSTLQSPDQLHAGPPAVAQSDSLCPYPNPLNLYMSGRGAIPCLFVCWGLGAREHLMSFCAHVDAMPPSIPLA